MSELKPSNDPRVHEALRIARKDPESIGWPRLCNESQHKDHPWRLRARPTPLPKKEGQ